MNTETVTHGNDGAAGPPTQAGFALLQDILRANDPAQDDTALVLQARDSEEVCTLIQTGRVSAQRVIRVVGAFLCRPESRSLSAAEQQNLWASLRLARTRVLGTGSVRRRVPPRPRAARMQRRRITSTAAATSGTDPSDTPPPPPDAPRRGRSPAAPHYLRGAA